MTCEGLFQTDRVCCDGGAEELACVRADPEVHMSDFLLGRVIGLMTYATLTRPAGQTGDDFTGAVLRIDCSASVHPMPSLVVYRVEGRCEHGEWLLRFPD